MNRAMRVLCSALVACASAAAPAAEPAPAETVDAFHTALKQKKRDAVLGLLANDARVFEQGFVEQSAQEYSGEHLAADIDFASTVPRTVTRREAGQSGDVAWVLTQATSKGKFKDTPVDLLQTETMLLRKHGGSWKIVHIHWSAHSAEPEE
jgi:ketosteroid isomerase-like protein